MDNDTFTSTFLAMRRQLSGLAVRILKSEDLAADAVQDAFCRMWKVRDKIDSENHAVGVGVTTVRNICIDSLRRDAAHASVAFDDGIATEAVDETDDATEREAVYLAVEDIIEHSLTDSQRNIIKLRECDNRSFDEIAELMDMNAAAVRMQLSRARKLVREHYRKIKDNE